MNYTTLSQFSVTIEVAKELTFTTPPDAIKKQLEVNLRISKIVSLLFTRLFYSRKKSVTDGLYSAALKNENNGDFREALTNYEIALKEVKKTRYNKTLKNKIIEKIKVLQTVIRSQKVF